jgi:hypothetical protein
MPNAEIRIPHAVQIILAKSIAWGVVFDIRHLDFFRHASFVIRH